MSIRTLFLLAATLGAAAVAALAIPTVSEAAPPKLVATVGPGETINLKTAGGAAVTTSGNGGEHPRPNAPRAF